MVTQFGRMFMSSTLNPGGTHMPDEKRDIRKSRKSRLYLWIAGVTGLPALHDTEKPESSAVVESTLQLYRPTNSRFRTLDASRQAILSRLGLDMARRQIVKQITPQLVTRSLVAIVLIAALGGGVLFGKEHYDKWQFQRQAEQARIEQEEADRKAKIEAEAKIKAEREARVAELKAQEAERKAQEEARKAEEAERHEKAVVDLVKQLKPLNAKEYAATKKKYSWQRKNRPVFQEAFKREDERRGVKAEAEASTGAAASKVTLEDKTTTTPPQRTTTKPKPKPAPQPTAKEKAEAPAEASPKTTMSVFQQPEKPRRPYEKWTKQDIRSALGQLQIKTVNPFADDLTEAEQEKKDDLEAEKQLRMKEGTW